MNITHCPQPSSPSLIPCPPYSSLSSFSTFHPPGQDRTSPEGSSCEEAENGEGSDQHKGESDEREEYKGRNEAEDTASYVTSVEDDEEYLYAKVYKPIIKINKHIKLIFQINYQSKHHARKSVKRSENNGEVKLSSKPGHSFSTSEGLI